MMRHIEDKDIISLLEGVRKIPPPVDFTEGVMNKLPDGLYKKKDRRRKIYDFLFAPKTLRWNMAGALASLFVIITIGFLLWTQIVPQTAYKTTGKETVLVRFSIYMPGAKNVSLVGDFNNWQPGEINLKERRGNGVWTAEVYLKPGRYNYMFLVDGQKWITDPNADTFIDDGFGNKNAVMKVGEA